MLFRLAVLLVLSSPILAQTQPFLENKILWRSDFKTAQNESDKANKPVLIYFSGSDWCKPCILWRERVLDTEQIARFTNEHFIALQADFPRLKKNQLSEQQAMHNEALAEKYNTEGTFPLIVIIDTAGKVLARIGYREETPDEFASRIKIILK